MREFNTSGQNIINRHYTLLRSELVEKGVELVKIDKYFTIWAPRQTGKSTYFTLLATALEKQGYKVVRVNFENYMNASLTDFLSRLTWKIKDYWNLEFPNPTIASIFQAVEQIKGQKFVLIVDEVEGINKTYFGSFLHAIRNAYHTRTEHALKSVILVGVSNITGIIQDHASPFNISNNLNVPFFTNEETYELLGQHEEETGQLFDKKVKDKIIEITANQPGLVNGFAQKLVIDYPNKKVIEYKDYLKVEDWYINKSIDKNVSNIVNKARKHRKFVERLLFTEAKIPFQIDRPAIKLLHTNGLITWDEKDNVIFWVPLYQKKLFNTYYPYINGEGSRISQTMLTEAYLTKDKKINFDKLRQIKKNN